MGCSVPRIMARVCVWEGGSTPAVSSRAVSIVSVYSGVYSTRRRCRKPLRRATGWQQRILKGRLGGQTSVRQRNPVLFGKNENRSQTPSLLLLVIVTAHVSIKSIAECDLERRHWRGALTPGMVSAPHPCPLDLTKCSFVRTYSERGSRIRKVESKIQRENHVRLA